VQPETTPETTYARLGEDRIAYQVLGDGPDLVLTMGAFGHVDSSGRTRGPRCSCAGWPRSPG
jgi:hypothetical protein